MKRNRNVLAIVALIFVAVSSVRAATPEGLEATVKRLEQRVIAQDEKIAAQDRKLAELKAKLNGEAAKRARHNEIKAIIEASTDANDLVDITVPGTGADVVTAVSQTYLEGGLSGGIIYTDQANGEFKITIPQDETFAVPAGQYVYDIIATILSTRTRLVGGCVQFITGVTE